MKRTRPCALLLAAFLCFSFFPATALASPFDFADGDALAELKAEAAAYPSSYDLRHVPTEDGGEVSYVTPVKVQNPYCTCWGFAAIAAAESSLLSSGLVQEYGYDANTLDLSEKQVAFFATSYLNDPEHSQHGEGFHFKKQNKADEKSYSYRYDTGGLALMATSVFASGIGPVLEKRFDPETGELVEDPLFSYRGKNAEAAYWEAPTQFDDDGQPVSDSYHLVPVWYSKNDDWYIPDDYRFYQEFRLKDSLVLPSPAGTDEDGNYVFRQEGVDAIKQQISQYHRAVDISFAAESYVPGQDTTGKLYMSDKWAHFTNEQVWANHSVTVVGYDDNYPRENFSSSTENGGPAQPGGNGAFLIKNSWGSELNDFPNNGHRHWGLLDGQDGVPYDPNAKPKEGNLATGYFWLSYYDRSLYDPEVLIFDKLNNENGYYVEQLDFLNISQVTDIGSDEETWMANVFTAEATSALSEISVMTTAPGTTVYYSIILLPDNGLYDAPTEGIEIAAGDASFEYGGYHRIQLDTPRVLAKDQKFAVLISESVGDRYHLCVSAEQNYDELYYYYVGIVNKGESYFYDGTGWKDLAKYESKTELLPCYTKSLAVDNFPIRAYLDPIIYQDGENAREFTGYLTVSNWQLGNPGAFDLKVGESITLNAEFRGLPQQMPASWDPSIEWEEHYNSILDISTKTPKKGQAVITAREPGFTLLRVSTEEYGDRVLVFGVWEEEAPAEVSDVKNILEDGSLACQATIHANTDELTACSVRSDANGRFLGMETMALQEGDNTFTVKRDGAFNVRFLVMDDSDGTPVCESVDAPMFYG